MWTLLKNLLVAFLALIPPVIVDYFFVRSGQNPESIWNSSLLAFPAYAVAPFGFFWANFSHYCNESKPWRYIFPTVISIVLTIVWFYVVALPLLIGFHLAFGGSL